MANTVNDTRPFINCQDLKMWKMTDEAAGTYSTTALNFSDRLTNYNDTLAHNETDLYGDGELVDTVVSEGKGTLTLGIHHVLDTERVDLYNEQTVTGAVVSTGDEIAPFFCVALSTKKRNGNICLRKWFKVAFQKHDESVTQQEANGTTYSMPTLTGSYTKNTVLGYKCARREVDPTTTEGQGIIAAWYNTAAYIGE